METADPPRALRILVADDNRDAADSVAVLLKLWGYEPAVAYDGPSALEVALACRPDVLLLDVALPGLSGYDLARRIRGHPGTGEALLVAVTGFGREEDRCRSREAGFDHHLLKPVEPGHLRQLLAGVRPVRADGPHGPGGPRMCLSMSASSEGPNGR